MSSRIAPPCLVDGCHRRSYFNRNTHKYSFACSKEHAIELGIYIPRPEGDTSSSHDTLSPEVEAHRRDSVSRCRELRKQFYNGVRSSRMASYQGGRGRGRGAGGRGGDSRPPRDE